MSPERLHFQYETRNGRGLKFVKEGLASTKRVNSHGFRISTPSRILIDVIDQLVEE
ncbi:predicted protein [Sclerotinia sclerotiorum 1980 UF-70]|uniref:Uncharacterized protein n=1 Tax=Sclerotinia sclerotiorum (strain ATCC 18683 / 1980 / Ss-1) TaxID=665079 RepID=A7EC05_SCLS1|nr:predicted protein [Sclerotinia sclerotiorum 1980 UF-70]EDN99983.1 predicted protein [Sclerotinia sclerotiorum 1980 UF-70]